MKRVLLTLVAALTTALFTLSASAEILFQPYRVEADQEFLETFAVEKGQRGSHIGSFDVYAHDCERMRIYAVNTLLNSTVGIENLELHIHDEQSGSTFQIPNNNHNKFVVEAEPLEVDLPVHLDIYGDVGEDFPEGFLQVQIPHNGLFVEISGPCSTTNSMGDEVIITFEEGDDSNEDDSETDTDTDTDSNNAGSEDSSNGSDDDDNDESNASSSATPMEWQLNIRDYVPDFGASETPRVFAGREEIFPDSNGIYHIPLLDENGEFIDDSYTHDKDDILVDFPISSYVFQRQGNGEVLQGVVGVGSKDHAAYMSATATLVGATLVDVTNFKGDKFEKQGDGSYEKLNANRDEYYVEGNSIDVFASVANRSDLLLSLAVSNDDVTVTTASSSSSDEESDENEETEEEGNTNDDETDNESSDEENDNDEDEGDDSDSGDDENENDEDDDNNESNSDEDNDDEDEDDDEDEEDEEEEDEDEDENDDDSEGEHIIVVNNSTNIFNITLQGPSSGIFTGGDDAESIVQVLSNTSSFSADDPDGYASIGFIVPTSDGEVAPVLSQGENIEDMVPEDVLSHWSLPYVHHLMKKGIISGYDDGTFKPEQEINRAELAKIVAMAISRTNNKLQDPLEFPDVDNGAWFHNYISQLTSSDVMHGYMDGFFRPNKFISRAEATKTLLLASGFRKQEIDELRGQLFNPFKDIEEETWFEPFVLKAYMENIVNGKENGDFDGNDAMTRAEAVKLVALVEALLGN